MRFAMNSVGATQVTGRLLLLIAILAVAGALVSSVSLYPHYGKSATSYCDFGESFNCDIVNRSTYSTIAGVPVALVGIFAYFTVLSLATFNRCKTATPSRFALYSIAGL